MRRSSAVVGIVGIAGVLVCVPGLRAYLADVELPRVHEAEFAATRTTLDEPTGSRLYFDTSCGTQMYFGALEVAKRGREAAPDLIATLAQDPKSEGSIRWAVYLMGSEADAVVPALLRLLDHHDPAVRQAASRVLGDVFGKQGAAEQVDAADEVRAIARQRRGPRS